MPYTLFASRSLYFITKIVVTRKTQYYAWIHANAIAIFSFNDTTTLIIGPLLHARRRANPRLSILLCTYTFDVALEQSPIHVVIAIIQFLLNQIRREEDSSRFFWLKRSSIGYGEERHVHQQHNHISAQEHVDAVERQPILGHAATCRVAAGTCGSLYPKQAIEPLLLLCC